MTKVRPPSYSQQKAIGHGRDGLDDLGWLLKIGGAVIVAAVVIAALIFWPR